MKKLLCLAALLLVTVTAAGAEPGDQLLTPDGTLFSVEIQTAVDRPDLAGDAAAMFVLTSRRGTEISEEVVPPTLTRGSHSNPSLAWEPESRTLFIFWIRHVSLLYNELLFASRSAEGVWSEPTKFGTPWNFRENLRIAVTRKADDPSTGFAVPGVSVHATWWEFDSSTGGEGTKYVMFSIDKGVAAAVDELDLSTFVAADAVPDAVPADVDQNLLKQPALFASRDRVLLTFGDLESRRLHRVTIRPTLPAVPNGRIRIPVGRNEGGIEAPQFSVAANSRVDGVSDGSDGLAFYTREGNLLRYVVYRDGAWSAQHEIAIDERVSGEAAIEALRRLVREH